MTKLFAHKYTANPSTQTDTFTLILIILSTRNSQLLRHYMTELTLTTPYQHMHDTKPPMFCLFYNSTVSLSGTPTPSPKSNNGTQYSILSTSPPYHMYRVLQNVSVISLTRGVASFARSGGKIKIRGAKVFAKFFWPKSQVISKKKQKKKVFTEIRRLFLAKSQIFRPNAGDLREKKRSSPKSEGFFWPKSQILTYFPPNNSNFFLPKKFRGGGKKKNRGDKNENRGGIAPLPLRWRCACF